MTVYETTIRWRDRNASLRDLIASGKPHELVIPKHIAPSTVRKVTIEGAGPSVRPVEEWSTTRLIMTRTNGEHLFTASTWPQIRLGAALAPVVAVDKYFAAAGNLRFNGFPSLLGDLDNTFRQFFLGPQHDRRYKLPWSWERHEPRDQYDLSNAATLHIPATHERRSLIEITRAVIDDPPTSLRATSASLTVRIYWYKRSTNRALPDSPAIPLP